MSPQHLHRTCCLEVFVCECLIHLSSTYTKWGCRELTSAWKSNQCAERLRNTRLLGTSSKGMRKALKPYVDKWEEEYFTYYNLTDNVHPNKYCQIKENIVEVRLNPTTSVLCAGFFDRECKKYNRNQASMRRSISNLCGCRVPPDDRFIKYTKQAKCDPMCNRVGVAQKVDLDTGGVP